MRQVASTIIAAILLLVGCAAVPTADQSLERVSPSQPRVVGATGPLSHQQTRIVLANIAGDTDQSVLQRHLAIEEAVAGGPLRVDNRVQVLEDAQQTFDVAFDAMKSADRHINLEYYILENIEHRGVALLDLLLRKLKEGVAVNIIYDSHGSSRTPKEFFDRLEKAGAKLLEFHPLNPLAVNTDYEPNDRNHRKILVVDGTLAIVGGINLSKTYQSKSSSGGDSESTSLWRDMAMLIEGPAVADLQRMFQAHWAEEKGPKLDEASFFPNAERKGSEVVRIIGSSPEQTFSRFYVTLLSAIRSAERRVWLTTAYFVPSDEALDDIKSAAERGVDVRLLLPGKTDIEETLAAARSNYDELLESGVKIYEANDVILHSKAVVVDGVWSAIGSSNLDHRSVLYNDEVDAVVLGAETAHHLEAVFKKDLASAKQITLEAWRDRPVTQRLNEFFSRFIEPLL